MELTHPKLASTINFRAVLREFFITFNVSYLMALFMFVLAFCIEVAPLDPLVRYMNSTHDYAPTALKYALLLFAALLWRAAPTRHPLNALLAAPLAFLYIMGARFLGDTGMRFEAVGTPWVSIALVYISIALIHLMLLGNFVFATLYRQVEECEAERHRSASATHG